MKRSVIQHADEHLYKQSYKHFLIILAILFCKSAQIKFLHNFFIHINVHSVICVVLCSCFCSSGK